MAGSTLTVTGNDGLHGIIEENNAENGQVTLRLEDGRRVLVPSEALTPQNDGSYHLDLSPQELNAAHTPRHAENVLTVPVIEETLHIEKRQVETGRTRIVKTIREREEILDAPLMREEVMVERVPINQVWEGAPPSVRYEGETLVLPLLEEVLVIEKRLMLKEEVHIRRRQTTAQEPQRVTLRSEEVTVERVEPPVV